MHPKKHYPDKQCIRSQSKQAANAIVELATLGVEIITITFRRPHPLIEVKHCPGTTKITHYLKGQGENQHGKYIRKVAHIQGCQIEWVEAR